MKALNNLHKSQHGVDGTFGSLDCIHTFWKNCAKGWQGSFQGKEGKEPSIVLEAIADYQLWKWSRWTWWSAQTVFHSLPCTAMQTCLQPFSKKFQHFCTLVCANCRIQTNIHKSLTEKDILFMCEVGGPLVVSCKGFSHFLCLLFFLPCFFFLANVIAFVGATFFLGSSGTTERLRFADLGFLQLQHSYSSEWQEEACLLSLQQF
jgi:hypothetical protein